MALLRQNLNSLLQNIAMLSLRRLSRQIFRQPVKGIKKQQQKLLFYTLTDQYRVFQHKNAMILDAMPTF
jgi:hypothetical protein